MQISKKAMKRFIIFAVLGYIVFSIACPFVFMSSPQFNTSQDTTAFLVDQTTGQRYPLAVPYDSAHFYHLEAAPASDDADPAPSNDQDFSQFFWYGQDFIWMGFSLIALCCTMGVIIAFVLMALVEWLNGLLNHFHNKHTEQ